MTPNSHEVLTRPVTYRWKRDRDPTYNFVSTRTANEKLFTLKGSLTRRWAYSKCHSTCPQLGYWKYCTIFLVEFKSTTSFPKQSARLLSRPQVQTARRKIEGLILWDLIWSITGFICHHLIRQNSCWIVTFIFLRTLAFRSEGPDVHRGEMQQEVFTPVLKIMILRNSPGGSHVR